ncbi:DDE-type integrase/transposase/recombinase [Methylobacter sp. BlB1]|uniref:DDE-type integrase/transposase/recombinase n=1 Tax=Methylobacter sp. BlB1 TaxID=2785914 RepID=UPI00351BDE27
MKKPSLFFKKAIHQHGLPDKVTVDQSGANAPRLEALQEETGHAVEIRQSKYLNNRIEQDHRAIKRIIRPMPGFKSFRSASIILQGIELMHTIKYAWAQKKASVEEAERHQCLVFGLRSSPLANQKDFMIKICGGDFSRLLGRK